MPTKEQKRSTIRNWKHRGIIFENMLDIIYNDYIKQTECECCGKPFFNNKDKQLDHDHNINDRYNIRGIICQGCNLRRYDKKWTTNTNERHICTYKIRGVVYYELCIFFDKKIILRKHSQMINDLIPMRNQFIIENPWIYTY